MWTSPLRKLMRGVLPGNISWRRKLWLSGSVVGTELHFYLCSSSSLRTVGICLVWWNSTGRCNQVDRCGGRKLWPPLVLGSTTYLHCFRSKVQQMAACSSCSCRMRRVWWRMSNFAKLCFLNIEVRLGSMYSRDCDCRCIQTFVLKEGVLKNIFDSIKSYFFIFFFFWGGGEVVEYAWLNH